MNRRQALGWIAGTLLSSACAHAQAPKIQPKDKRRVVVIGGGIAGSGVVQALRRRLPSIDITLIEPNERYIVGPMMFDYLFGSKDLSEVSMGYDSLLSQNIRLVRSSVQEVDTVKKQVRTSTALIPYDVLVLATGNELLPGDIQGIEDPGVDNLCVFDRSTMARLRSRLASPTGNIILSAPDTRLTCPPAPYEFALLLAHRIRETRAKAKVVFLDQATAPQPLPLAALFEEEIFRFRDEIEYVRSTGDVEVHADQQKVTTSLGEDYPYNTLCLTPRNTVAPFVRAMELVEFKAATFVAVNPVTMQTYKNASIYAVGDVAQLPYGRSAYAATVEAEFCAQHIANPVASSELPIAEVMCFPTISPNAALALRVKYTVKRDTEGKLYVESSAQISEPSASNLSMRLDWQDRVAHRLYGYGLSNTNNV